MWEGWQVSLPACPISHPAEHQLRTAFSQGQSGDPECFITGCDSRDTNDRTPAVWQRPRSLAREKGTKDHVQTPAAIAGTDVVPVEGLQQGEGKESPCSVQWPCCCWEGSPCSC